MRGRLRVAQRGSLALPLFPFLEATIKLLDFARSQQALNISHK